MPDVCMKTKFSYRMVKQCVSLLVTILLAIFAAAWLSCEKAQTLNPFWTQILCFVLFVIIVWWIRRWTKKDFEKRANREIVLEDGKIEEGTILKAVWMVKPTDIFLDGMLDIVKDYNDQVECQPIIRKSMMLATHYDSSMWMVLHENPLVDKLVGTLGSIVQRKVAEIFTVRKTKQSDLKPNEKRLDRPEIFFTVKQLKARGRDVADWDYAYNQNAAGWGMPVELDDNSPSVQAVDTKEMEMMKEADERFKAYNWTSSGATYTELEKYLRSKGVTSNRHISNLFNVAMEKGIIYKSNKKKYHYNGIKELPQDTSEQLPFDRPEEENVDF